MEKFKGLLVFVLLFVSVFFINSSKVLAESDAEYLKVNNTTLEFEKIIYIDGTSGDDTNGDGSKDNPFKTVVKGFNNLNENCREGGAIVLKDGTYDVSGLFSGSSDNLSSKYNGMKLSLIAETLGKVTFNNIGQWMVVENSSSARIKICFYGIIFNSIYSQSYYHLGGDDWINEYYNCVLKEGYGGWNGIVSSANIKVENCLFVGSPSSIYTSRPLTGTAINCTSTTSYIDPYNGTKTNCLYNITIDENYNITSSGWENAGTGTNPDGTVANIGVYGGEFSWDYNQEIDAPIGLTAVANNESKTISLSWVAVSDAASYNIKRSTTAGGPYETVASSSAITFTDTDVEAGTTYYYVVSVVVSDAESSDSNEASATIELAQITNILKVVLEVGEDLQLSVDDDLDENFEMIWTSSNNTVATVDGNGIVTALTPGNTIITVTSADGSYMDYINVLVVDDADDYRLAVDLKVGKSCRLTVDDLTDTVKVTWDSSDTSVATISSKGKVTAVSEGLTLITATDEEGNVIGQVYVRVRE